MVNCVIIRSTDGLSLCMGDNSGRNPYLTPIYCSGSISHVWSVEKDGRQLLIGCKIGEVKNVQVGPQQGLLQLTSPGLESDSLQPTRLLRNLPMNQEN